MFNNICPVCGESDQVQNVAAIISEGTSVNMNVGAVFTGGGIGGIAPAILGGVSKSNLARRLSPRSEAPGDANMFWWLVGVVIISIIAAMVVEPIWFPGVASFQQNPIIWAFVVGICWVGTFVVCYLAALPAAIIYRWSRPRARRRWFNSAAYLNASYYCHRDGVAFDGVTYGAPESFVAHVFANNR